MIKKLLIMGSIISVFAALCAAEPTGAQPPPHLPGITRTTNNIYLIENHSTAFTIWHAHNIKGATLVHLDTHDDCRYIPPEKLDALRKRVVERQYREIFENSDVEFSFRYRLKPDRFLFDLGNFIYPCIMDGTVSRFYWVIPEKKLDENRKISLQAHFKEALKLASLVRIHDTNNAFSFNVSNCMVTVTTLDALPQLDRGALLDIDTDFFVFNTALSDSHITTGTSWDPSTVCSLLAQRVPKPAIVSISSSISGGFLPVAFRFLSDAFFEYFVSGIYPDDAVNLLKSVLTMISKPSAVPEVHEASNTLFRPAYEHLTGLSLVMQGQENKAMDCMERAAQLQPAYSKAMLDLAVVFISMDKWPRAHEMIDRFEKFTGCRTSQSEAMRVRVYLAEKQFEKADTLVRKLMAWDHTPYFLMFYGGLLVEQGRYAEAVRVYKETLRLHPDNASAYYNMGIALWKQNKTDEAIEYYKAAIMLNPGLTMALENLGCILLDAGKYAEAIAYLQKAVALNPFNVSSLNNLGLALAKQNRFADAGDYYNAALKINPERPEIHANLAAALISSGKLDEGIEQCRKALALKPDWPEVINLMNDAGRRKGGAGSQK